MTFVIRKYLHVTDNTNTFGVALSIVCTHCPPWPRFKVDKVCVGIRVGNNLNDTTCFKNLISQDKRKDLFTPGVRS